jgi:hypothetical protein
MSDKEFQASNVTPPLKNTTAMKCIAVFAVGPTVQTVDLDTLFGSIDNGNFLTVRADGAKVYVAFGSSAGTIDDRETGTGTGACGPVADGENFPVIPIGGREIFPSGGVATGAVRYEIMHYKTPTGVSGYLRLYRSSTQHGRGSEDFPAP